MPFIIIKVFYCIYFLIFAKGVCTPSCFLLIQLSVASHFQCWMHKIGTSLPVLVPMFLTSAIQATHCLVQREEPATQMENGTEWNHTAVCKICYEGLGVLDQFKIPKIHTMFRTKDKCYRANSLYQKLLLLNSWSTNNSSSKLNQSCRQIYPFNRLKKKIHTLLRTT